MASLEVQFAEDLGDGDKVQFLWDLWTINISEDDVKDYSSYFHWLGSQIKRFLDERDIEDPETARLIVHTYGGFLLLVAFIRENTDVKRRDIIDCFHQYAPFKDQRNRGHIHLDSSVDDTLVLDTILLAIKAWSMVALEDFAPGEPTYLWKNDESLNDTLKRYLPLPHTPSQDTPPVTGQRAMPSPPSPPSPPPPQKPHQSQNQANASASSGSSSTALRQQEDRYPHPLEDTNHNREFEGFFTFHDMHTLSSFKIRWTNNFLSHLRVRRLRERGFTITIFVFHHATVLPAIANVGPDHQKEYAREALGTLGLLIPSDPDCLKWFQANAGEDIDLNAGCQFEPSRFVQEFCMWRANLLAIEREWDNSSPRSLNQWWKDRRRRREWLPFWVAAIIVMLTIVSLLLSLISAVAGVVAAQEAVAAREVNNKR